MKKGHVLHAVYSCSL